MKHLFGIFACLILSATAHAQEVPTVDDFAAMSNMTQVGISPDGEQIVFLSGETRADRNIIVVSLVGNSPVVIDGGDDQIVVGVSWLSNEHILVQYNERRYDPGRAETRDITRPYIIRVQDQNVVELELGMTLANIDLENPNSVLMWLRARHGRGTDRVGNRASQGVSLYNIDLDTGRRQVEFHGTGAYRYVLNAENEAVIRYARGEDEFEMWSRINTNSWELQHEERFALNMEFHFMARTFRDWIGVMRGIVALDRSGRYGYFGSETLGAPDTLSEGRRQAIFRYDFQEGQIEGPVHSSDRADINGAMIDWRDNSIIGIRWEEERRHVEYFDEEFAELYEQIQGFFPSSNVTMDSWDAAFQKVIIYISGGSTSGVYYLLDRISGEVTLLSASRPRIPDTAVSPVEVVHYTAQDGLEMFGYLTIPQGADPASLPAVLMPHGGPEARDYYGFHNWAQFLASRGYAVFQPQFRGSDGFGREFVERGYGNWGEEMQTDIWDGMEVLIERGIVDRERVCLFGWSYGGYAAFAGATMTPELYRCVIAGAGVANINTMMDFERESGNGDSQVYWARNIGDWRTDPAHTRAISPVYQVANMSVPLMIIHGTDDQIVPFSQSEEMARALDEVGKPYEFVAIEDGPHQSIRMTVSQVTELFSNLERFLLEHNPPD
jgi:dipeptidyl aminopeptidase/acylaminoacyl peptidase